MSGKERLPVLDQENVYELERGLLSEIELGNRRPEWAVARPKLRMKSRDGEKTWCRPNEAAGY